MTEITASKESIHRTDPASDRIDVRVARKSLEAPDVCSVELVDAAGGELPAFSAGSHIDVHLAPGLVRQYSLCNPPWESHRYLIGVLREPSSRGGSRRLHDGIEVGDVLQISTPRNLFGLESSAGHSVLMAGGIGVTPILCMAEHLARANASFELHYCTRTKDRTAFRRRIEASSFADRATFWYDDQAAGAKFDPTAIAAEATGDTHCYVCGPAGYIQWVLDSLSKAGWPDERIHREYFAPAIAPVSADSSFQIRLARSGKVFNVPAGQTVIETLALHGIAIHTSCEQGVCGTCVTPVLEGRPDHRDMFLTAKERARNDRFTPCCSRSCSDLLVLDL